MAEELSTTSKCELCGEPMPKGEEMFRFHGHSGPCPMPPLRTDPPTETERPDAFKTLKLELLAIRTKRCSNPFDEQCQLRDFRDLVDRWCPIEATE